MIEKLCHSLFWLFALLLVYLAVRVSAHNREGEPVVPERDSLGFIPYFGAMEEGELVDTAANRLGGEVETLSALFDRLYTLETWYDRWGRSGREPFSGGEPLPDSLWRGLSEEFGDVASEAENPSEEDTRENPSAAIQEDTLSNAVKSEVLHPEAEPSAGLLPPKENGTTGQGSVTKDAVTVDTARKTENAPDRLLPLLSETKSESGIYPRPRPMEPPAENYPFDPLREVVNILQLGDSHVQGGFYPNQVRVRLQYRFGNAGRGLLTPYRLMRTNQPQGYEISSLNEWERSRCTELHPLQEVGATGAAISTGDPTFELVIATPGDPFQRITAFHHRQAPLLWAVDNACEIGCPWEDTPTMTRIPLRDPADRVVLRGDTRDSLYNVPVFHGFMLENGHSGLLYHSVGINGNTFAALARQPQIIREAAQLMPDLIIISLGTNDSYGRFEADQIADRLSRVIETCRQYAPQSALLLTTPMECYSRVRSRGRIVRRLNPNAVRVRNVILEVARRESLPYWDFYAAAGGEGAMERWYKRGIARADRVHLTPEGYRLQGEMLYQALIQAYESYKRGRNMLPR